VIATADSVQAARRSERRIDISFDEWNVWYMDRDRESGRITGLENWPYAPRLLEDQYSVTDAVVVGSLLISLLKHADRVQAACLAQLVNVIAPIMTEPGGPAWRQTIFFPFAITARLARGTVLRLAVESPTYGAADYGTVPLVDAIATIDDDSGSVAVLLVHRGLDTPITVSIDVGSLGPVQLGESITLADDDPTLRRMRQQAEGRGRSCLRLTVGLRHHPGGWSAVRQRSDRRAERLDRPPRREPCRQAQVRGRHGGRGGVVASPPRGPRSSAPGSVTNRGRCRHFLSVVVPYA
jgi:alpha-N-arabinofuranosidase